MWLGEKIVLFFRRVVGEEVHNDCAYIVNCDSIAVSMHLTIDINQYILGGR